MFLAGAPRGDWLTQLAKLLASRAPRQHVCNGSTESLRVPGEAGEELACSPSEGVLGGHAAPAGPSPPVPESVGVGAGQGSYLGYSVRGAHSFPSGKQNKGMALSSRSSSSCWPRSRFSRCKEQGGRVGGSGRGGRRRLERRRASTEPLKQSETKLCHQHGVKGCLCLSLCAGTSSGVWKERPPRLEQPLLGHVYMTLS